MGSICCVGNLLRNHGCANAPQCVEGWHDFPQERDPADDSGRPGRMGLSSRLATITGPFAVHQRSFVNLPDCCHQQFSKLDSGVGSATGSLPNFRLSVAQFAVAAECRLPLNSAVAF